MFLIISALVLSLSVALPSILSGNYWEEFVDGSKEILRRYNLYDRELVLDTDVGPTEETITWTQWSRCALTVGKCTQKYNIYDYYLDGNKNNPTMKVFVADGISAPTSFNTIGNPESVDIDGKLHFGFLIFGDAGQAIFFVIHPNELRPFQHRFMTNSMTDFFHSAVETFAENGGKLIAESIGSLIDPQLLEQFNAVGGTVDIVAKDYIGDFLRYIG